MLSGYKEIAAFLEQVWGVSVSEYSAYRYSRRPRNPLPVRRIQVPGGERPRIAAEASRVERWARMAIRAA